MANWAIIVGINTYLDPPLDKRSLKGAVADAVEFAEWALDPNGGDVPASNLVFWTHPWPTPPPGSLLAGYLAAPTPWTGALAPTPARPPTSDEIRFTAWDMVNANNQNTNSRIFVFFAGHGVETTSITSGVEEQTCFIVGGFRPVPTSGLVPCNDLAKGLRASGFGEVIMFLDCCRTALSISQQAPSLGFPNAKVPKTGLGIGYAAWQGDKAYEVPPANPMRGAFTKLLVEALRGERTAASALTLNIVDQYVLNNINDLVAGAAQSPFFFYKRNPPFLLSTAPRTLTKASITIAFSPQRVQQAGPAFVFDAFNRKVAGPITPANGSHTTAPVELGLNYVIELAGHVEPHLFLHNNPGGTHVSY